MLLNRCNSAHFDDIEIYTFASVCTFCALSKHPSPQDCILSACEITK